MLSGHPVLGSLTHSRFCLDSLNVPPQHMATHTRFTCHCFPILFYQPTEMTNHLLSNWKWHQFTAFWCKECAWPCDFQFFSQVLATMGQVQFWFINTDCRIMAKLKDTFSTEMGDFKLYSAWHIKAGIIWRIGAVHSEESLNNHYYTDH